MENQGNIFYVYALLDTRKKGEYKYGDYSFEYEPFYIGKGKKYTNTYERIHDHFIPNSYKFLRSGNILKKSIIKKIIKETKKDPLVIKIKEQLKESDSFMLERELIKLIGRRDLGKGCLANMTDGGDGPSGAIISEEQRKKLSKATKKQFEKGFPEETKEKIRNTWTEEKRKKQSETKRKDLELHGHPMKGKHHTKEMKQKLRDIFSKTFIGKGNPFYGKHHSKETIEKIKKKTSGEKSHMAKEYILTYPDGKQLFFKGLRKFCKENNINRGVLVETLKTKKPLSKGKHMGYKLEVKE